VKLTRHCVVSAASRRSRGAGLARSRHPPAASTCAGRREMKLRELHALLSELEEAKATGADPDADRLGRAQAIVDNIREREQRGEVPSDRLEERALDNGWHWPLRQTPQRLTASRP
jgi:hypothetical protein